MFHLCWIRSSELIASFVSVLMIESQIFVSGLLSNYLRSAVCYLRMYMLSWNVVTCSHLRIISSFPLANICQCACIVWLMFMWKSTQRCYLDHKMTNCGIPVEWINADLVVIFVNFQISRVISHCLMTCVKCIFLQMIHRCFPQNLIELSCSRLVRGNNHGSTVPCSFPFS